MATLLYRHGAVDLLIRESNKPTNDINPRLFAEVLIDVVGKSEKVQQNKQSSEYRNPSLANFKSAMQTLNHTDVVSILRLAFNNAELRANTRTPEVNEAAVYDQLVLQIEAWYKEFTERRSLWYKKRGNYLLLVSSLVCLSMQTVCSYLIITASIRSHGSLLLIITTATLLTPVLQVHLPKKNYFKIIKAWIVLQNPPACPSGRTTIFLWCILRAITGYGSGKLRASL